MGKQIDQKDKEDIFDETQSVDVAKLKNYIAIILDSSSSMNSIRQQALTHVNEQINEIQKQTGEMETRVTFVTFSGTVEFKLFNISANEIEEITNYTPSGNTALYDAIGLTIDKFEKEISDIDKKESSVLFIIVTDGEENASHIKTRQQVRERIEELQKENWTFTFLGANVDVLKEAVQNLSIFQNNVSSFTADTVGVATASLSTQQGLNTFYRRRMSGETRISSFYEAPNTTMKKEDE